MFSSWVPTEAPSCWPTVTVAKATPTSYGATPKVPVLIDGALTVPVPNCGQDQRAEHARGIPGVRAQLGQPDRSGGGLGQHAGAGAGARSLAQRSWGVCAC